MDGDHHRKFEFNPILIGMFGVIAGAMTVATYQCITLGCCYYRRTQEQRNIHQTMQNRQQERPTSTRTSTTITLIPVITYAKECNEETCCVCLCEFKEGEQIRVLPECLHLFHVACIDMWLSSHSNCPLCRTDTMPPQHVMVSLPDPDGVPPPELHRVPDFRV